MKTLNEFAPTFSNAHLNKVQFVVTSLRLEGKYNFATFPIFFHSTTENKKENNERWSLNAKLGKKLLKIIPPDSPVDKERSSSQNTN